jgi:uncharacterized membrane protein (TIGR02234 family)
MPEPRATFVPVVGLGLASGILTAVASSRTWLDYDNQATRAAIDPVVADTGAGEMPIAAALALVLLACWGVVLVIRGGVRRVVAILSCVAALGIVVAVVYAWFLLPDQRPQPALLSESSSLNGLSWTGWYWAAVVGSVLSVVTTAAAVRWVGHWPEMGSRFDAPGGAGASGAEAPPEDPSSLDLWKSIDEGRDPTV